MRLSSCLKESLGAMVPAKIEGLVKQKFLAPQTTMNRTVNNKKKFLFCNLKRQDHQASNHFRRAIGTHP